MNGLKRSFISLVTLGVLATPASVLAQTRTWTTTQDFDQGEFVNLNPATAVDQLQINTWSETKDASPAVLPYLWVACSERGTIVRIATSTFDPLTQQTVSVGDVLGEYWTAPEGCRTSGGLFSGPSRTTVDFDGGVWVGNRNDLNNADCGETTCGHVVKIGNGLAFQWKDRPIGEDPPNATLDTSSGLGDIKDWPNPDGTCDPGDVDSAADELILVYQPVPATGTRTVAVDRNNDVWVGGNGNRWHGLIDGQTGENLEGFEFGPTTCGGYGGLVDCNGVLWSAWQGSSNALLLRLDPNGGNTCIPLRKSYGLAADTLGFIWNSRFLDQLIAKLDPDGVVLNNYPTGGDESRGVVITPEDNDVWIANSFTHSVTRLNSAGTLLNTIFTQAGGSPTGVAVDSDGFVWVTNRDTDTVQRINPATNAVDLTKSLGSGCLPYNYSDMTGVNLYHTISPAGVWTDVYDSGASGTVWETATWTETLGHANSTVRVSARAADVETDLGKKKYRDVQNGVPLTCAQCDLLAFPDCEFLVGRYIQVRVQLNAFCHQQAWPTLQDLTVQADPTGQDCQPNGIPDECDLAMGNSPDCDEDSVPDECQVPPICMTCSDCNANGVPDACEPDCNANDVPDECDLTAGTSCDLDENGVLDECGACCEDSVCRNSVSWQCQFGLFADGVGCDEESCEIRGCCVDSACRTDLNLSQCLAIRASRIYSNSSCGFPSCTMGACCFPLPSCEWSTNEASCGDQGGTFFGGTYCSMPGVCDAPIVDCDNDCLDDDPPGSTETVLTSTSYACDDSLSRVMNNVLRFQFACPITLPAAGAVEINELLEGGIPFGPDLSAGFTFTLEGTPGFETILRVEENGDVLANKTWYTVRNAGNWLGVAAFQVDYASIYGDADNDRTTQSADLTAIYNVIVSGSDCSDDSRFDIDTLGCVGFSDMATAFNYIPSSVAKPGGHDCPGSSQQSQGGGSSPGSSSLTVSATPDPAESLSAADDAPAIFVTWLPNFLSELEVPESQRAGSVDELLRVLVTWAVENLTDDQRDAVAGALSDPSRTFADPTVAALAQGMARTIAP